jgi:hypothetical protein
MALSGALTAQSRKNSSAHQQNIFLTLNVQHLMAKVN